ncbi:MAG: putative Ig domain-containing protein [Candidatus Thiodiazotropha sp. (ex Codakia orbicularis)]|nr:putative Ig domain-containing protein [Candidatus Thiodiazotropha sp. (ex Codakia orbicularis)]
MKALHTLLPLVVLPALFLTEMSQLQAGTVAEESYAEPAESFSFEKAVWRKRKDLLVLKGNGTPGVKVDVFIAGTDLYLGSKTVNKRGYWRLKFYNPANVPCGVRTEYGTLVQERAVVRAPADCVSGSEPEPPAENRPPVISGTPQTQVAEGQTYRFTPSANDADGDTLTFSIANRPSWANFNTSTGQLSGTPDQNAAGTTNNIVISCSDGSASASLDAFSITVDDSNQAPTISGTPDTRVAEGAGYRFAPQAHDADGDSLTFSIDNRPDWASFNPSTGVLSGTPGYGSAGTTDHIVISVSDGNAVASLNAFSITVSDTNRAPSISGTPDTSIEEGDGYSFTPAASDPDGDALTFSISNRPYWAAFNPNSGRLSGTPDSESAGTYRNIVITVSDGSDSVSLDGFTITINDVAEPNNAPVISGTAEPSIIAGNEYRFAPDASDADNDELTFSASNLPAWASLNTQTGVLSGTPNSEDIGRYDAIVITVTDGIDSASLSPLSIEVVEPEPTVGSVSLAWVPPSTRTDGSALDMSEIAGYKIYMGTTTDNLQQVMDLADCTIHDYVIDNLDVGDYYFAVTTYDTEGNESDYSNVAMKSTM